MPLVYLRLSKSQGGAFNYEFFSYPIRFFPPLVFPIRATVITSNLTNNTPVIKFGIYGLCRINQLDVSDIKAAEPHYGEISLWTSLQMAVEAENN